jgi:hypothetical protein
MVEFPNDLCANGFMRPANGNAVAAATRRPLPGGQRKRGDSGEMISPHMG